jgi:predicted O-methyltransferase YrrM
MNGSEIKRRAGGTAAANGTVGTAFVNEVSAEIRRHGADFDTECIKQISLQNEVPVICDETKNALISALQKYKPKRILEIGGGMGYSGSVILSAAAPAELVSVEKNEARYLVLKKVLSNCTAVWDDAYNALAKFTVNDGGNEPSYKQGMRGKQGMREGVCPTQMTERMTKFNEADRRLDGGTFDFVFLDGPKAQYGKYFNLIHKLLPRGGVIFADNTDFHGMVTGAIPTTKGARTIVNGLKDFRTKLENSKYQIDYIPQGDGIIIATKT